MCDKQSVEPSRTGSPFFCTPSHYLLAPDLAATVVTTAASSCTLAVDLS